MLLCLASVLVKYPLPIAVKIGCPGSIRPRVTFIFSDCFTRRWWKEPRSCDNGGRSALLWVLISKKKAGVYSARARSATKSNIWLNSVPQYESRVLQKTFVKQHRNRKDSSKITNTTMILRIVCLPCGNLIIEKNGAIFRPSLWKAI